MPLHEPRGTAAKVVLLIGLGESASFSPAAFQRAVTAATRAAMEHGATQICNYLTTLETPKDAAHRIKQALLATADAAYRFDHYKGTPKKHATRLGQVHFASARRGRNTAEQRALREAEATAEGMQLARDLANQPPNVCTPAYLARAALRLRASHGLKVRVLERAAMRKLGMGALLAVAQGSRQTPRFIILEHRGVKGSQAPIVPGG